MTNSTSGINKEIKEASDSYKLHVSGLRCICRGFQTWDTLQDSTDDSSIYKFEASLERQEHFSQFQDMTDAFLCHIHLPVRSWIMDPHSRAAKLNTSHGIEVLPQDTTHLIQRPCYQRGSPCQDPTGNWTTWRSPDDRKETLTAGVCSCLPFIRSGQNHLARHSERGKKENADRGRGGKTTSGYGQSWSSLSPWGQWRTKKNGGNWLWSNMWCPNDTRG